MWNVDPICKPSGSLRKTRWMLGVTAPVWFDSNEIAISRPASDDSGDASYHHGYPPPLKYAN